jgi:hypothetical protein
MLSYLQLLFGVAWLLVAARAVSAEPQLRVVVMSSNLPVAVEVINWPVDRVERLAKGDAATVAYLQGRFRVHVADEKGNFEPQAIAGRYEVVEGRVRFTPSFPFRPSLDYRADFFPPPPSPIASPAIITLNFKVPPEPPKPPTNVTAIYPSADTLPENQLRFYIHFSAPMAAGEAYRHIKLLKADGTEVKRAFLEIGEELWDGTGQRLTLLFDPGRVKQGLKPREEFGPVLVTGESYRLVIDPAWRDANNQPLAAGFEKRFKAGPMVDSAVDAKHWKIESPAAGSRNVLSVTFDRPLDRALLMRMITVAGSHGKSIEGDISVSNAERQWRFIPEQPWQAGEYALLVDPALEDSAGNNLERAFEIDVFDRVDDRARPTSVRIPFRVSAR